MKQEFKEAARLAAEAKACAGEADACDKRAAQARADAEHARLASGSHGDSVTREHASIASAKQALALTRWRRLQVGLFASRQLRLHLLVRCRCPSEGSLHLQHCICAVGGVRHKQPSSVNACRVYTQLICRLVYAQAAALTIQFQQGFKSEFLAMKHNAVIQ